MAETWGIKGMAHRALTAAIDAGDWKEAAHVLERKRIGFKRLWGWLDDNYAFDKPDGLERTFDNICECTQFKKDVLNLYYEKRWNSALATMIDWQIEAGLLTKWLESEGRELSPDFRMHYIRAMSEFHYRVAQALRPVLIGGKKAGRTKTPTNLREKLKKSADRLFQHWNRNSNTTKNQKKGLLFLLVFPVLIEVLVVLALVVFALVHFVNRESAKAAHACTSACIKREKYKKPPLSQPGINGSIL